MPCRVATRPGIFVVVDVFVVVVVDVVFVLAMQGGHHDTRLGIIVITVGQ